MSHVNVFVPASTANLGPGFDTLAIALNLVNRFEIICPAERNDFEIISGMDPSLKDACLPMVLKTANLFFERTGTSSQPIIVKSENHVPIARGLGSSGTMRLAVLFGLKKALNVNVSDEELLCLAEEMEKSTDNTAASFYGGMTASGIINGKYHCYQVDVPEEIDFVAISPNTFVKTDDAREVFTPQIPREDAVISVKHAALLSMAFAKQDYDAMGDLFADRMHQTYRQAKIPALKSLYDVIDAARGAGAIGGFLSGSGSTMMAITKKDKDKVGEAMKSVIEQTGVTAEIRYLKADNIGLRYESI